MQGIIGHRTAVPLGRGSTSQVYRVYDDQRQRWLAVKYLHHGDPVWRSRLVREARAVRQLDHPHICPILEIGEHDGRPWLSMPLIEGRTLDQAANELPLEARVRVLKQVAEAVHHAHEHGLLHRDLKPANIIVQLDDGLPHAWVLDFGLIREVGTSNGTQLGEIVGTPAYMAPEQARGQNDLDRRTDVYSLGAILYVLLTGQPPFSGTSSAEVLARTIGEQPIPPHRRRAGVPRGLSAIALQCLEKSPDRRYDSARALANDLDRYLHGSPVAARRGIGITARRLIRRHPRLAPVGATLVAAAIVLATMLAVQSARTREQVHQATRIAAQAESARQQLALAFTRPAHDVRPSLAQALSTADGLLQDAASHSTALRANALAAAGSIHLATRNTDEARRYLLAAAEIAPSPDLHRLIGLAYARAYRAVLTEPALLSDPLLRQTRIQRARLELLDPARHHLTAAGDEDWLAQAELAFTEERYEEARSLLAQALQQQPDAHEARVIDAEVLMTLGQQAHWASERPAAVEMLSLADVAIGEALEFARSDPLLHRRRCEVASLRYEAMAEGAHSRQALLDDVKTGLATCQQALRVQPDAAATHAALAQLLGNRAKIERITGGDAVTTLRQALASASTAVDLGTRRHTATCFACADNADAARAARMLALLNMRLSTTLRWSGQPAPELTETAETALQPWLGAVNLDPELLFIAALVAGEKGQTLAAGGSDPEPDLRRSIDLLRQATALVPQAAFVRHNLASMLSSLQYHLANQGRPDPALSREAIGEIEAVLRDQPERASAWSSLADSHWDLALTLAYRGEPLGESLAVTHSHYAQALERAPDNLGIMFNWYSFSLFAAGEQLRNDGDASADIERAHELMDRMDRIRPDWITPCPRAEYHLRRATLSMWGAQPSQGRRHLALARDLLGDALEQQPDDVDCARRSIELAVLRLTAGDADTALVDDLFADARPHYQNHRDIPQIQLAWLELLASGAGRLHGDDRERVNTEMRALKKALLSRTGTAWGGRLSVLAIDD